MHEESEELESLYLFTQTRFAQSLSNNVRKTINMLFSVHIGRPKASNFRKMISAGVKRGSGGKRYLSGDAFLYLYLCLEWINLWNRESWKSHSCPSENTQSIYAIASRQAKKRTSFCAVGSAEASLGAVWNVWTNAASKSETLNKTVGLICCKELKL
jgi:hypothetical protein